MSFEIKMPQVLNEKEGGIQLSVPDMCSVDSEAWTAESEFLCFLSVTGVTCLVAVCKYASD